MHPAFLMQRNLFTSNDQKVAITIQNELSCKWRNLTLGHLVVAGTLSDVSPKPSEFQSKYHLVS